ncbi:MAG TPA: PPC domain-containing DNA-binding protein [Burkholderiaceae bacterium]|jgi:predicted DNA-binding protein with PD1-like motif|nr:PPC domain-containing DNA-binding protein [Burkholderiaceae bacterium]
MNFHAFRLAPGDDLKQALLAYCAARQITAACIVSCVGSLQDAVIRFADQAGGAAIHKKFEIVSLVGTLGCDACHLHIALADEQGQVIGGHLMAGSIIYTTAEIVLGVLPELRFERELDTATGYQELRVVATLPQN